jgi:hypothetical protein
VVIATKTMIDRESGDWGLPTPCVLCSLEQDESFYKIEDHLKSEHGQEIQSWFASEKDKISTTTIDKFRQHLINRAWFRDRNYPSWWEKRGILIPQKCTTAIKAEDATNI